MKQEQEQQENKDVEARASWSSRLKNMWPPFKVSISETKVKFWPHIAAHFSISLCLNCWGGCVVAMQSVSICVKVKSKKWTTNDCEEEEEEEAQAGKDGKISMGSFPAKKMLWCFVSRIIHKNCDAMCKRWCPRPRPSKLGRRTISIWCALTSCENHHHHVL